MDIQQAIKIAGEAVAFLTALTTFLGTIRNGLTHLGWISTDESTKFGKFLDRMAWVAEKGKTGVAGVVHLPFLASRTPAPTLAVVPDPRSDKGSARIETLAGVTALSFLFLILVLAGIFMSGCATSFTKPGSTFGQKTQDDITAIKQVAADVTAQCPKLAPIANLVAAAVSVAQDPYDLINDITQALRGYEDLRQDYSAISCAVKVVLEDYKKLKPTSATAAKTAMLEHVLQILDEGPSVGDMQCASSSSP